MMLCRYCLPRAEALSVVRSARARWSALLFTTLLAAFSHPVSAQTTVNSSTTQLPSGAGAGGGSATNMWGASGSSSSAASSSLSDSANAHEALGESAALVQSAKRGFLYSSGTSIVFESIGSQSIVDTSIYGDGNIANISANQTSTNNGSVNATGAISLNGNATTTTPATGTSNGGSSAPSSNTPGSSTTATGGGSTAATGNSTTTTGNSTTSSTTVGAPPTSSTP